MSTGPDAAEDVGEPDVIRPSVNELAEVLADPKYTSPQQRLQRRFELLSALMERKN